MRRESGKVYREANVEKTGACYANKDTLFVSSSCFLSPRTITP